MRVYRKGRAARWAGVVGACNTFLVAAYFLVASAWAETTFFGDQPTPQMEHESSQLETCGMLVLILATPVAAYVAWACVRAVERRRPGNAARAVGLIVLLGFLGFCGAIFATRWFPTDARPFAFGFLGLARSALVVPVLVAVGLATFERIPDRDPTEVHPLR